MVPGIGCAETHETDINVCPLLPIRETEIMAAFLKLSYNLKRNLEIFQYLLKTDQKIRERQMLWSPGVVELNSKISDISNQSHQLALSYQHNSRFFVWIDWRLQEKY